MSFAEQGIYFLIRASVLLALGNVLPHPITDFLWSELLLDGHDRPEVSVRVPGHTEAVAPERVFGRHDWSGAGIQPAFIGGVYVVDIDLQGDAGPPSPAIEANRTQAISPRSLGDHLSRASASSQP